MKKIDVLLGLQWGDEGKGKVVDVLSPNFDVVARFQGGPNAGHSLEFGGQKHILHTIPSGIFHEKTFNIIGNGVVLDPVVFATEIAKLREHGIEPTVNLAISKKTHLIVPSHRELDAASEAAKGKAKIGSTLKGIGPAYMDKTGRNGLRVGNISQPDFLDRYQLLKQKHQSILKQYDQPTNIEQHEKAWFEGIEILKQFRHIDSEYEMSQLMAEGKSILAEGAQGTLLDIDFGSYPFVTSSNTICAGACTGLGIAPASIGRVMGIVKSYCTRVGSGPFPTELNDDTGQKLRDLGREYGSTTGRPRRCGWLDLVALRYAVMLNGVTHLILTKADVLDTFETIKLATAYRVNGRVTQQMPFDMDAPIEPIYTELKGWNNPTTHCRKKEQLPAGLIHYMEFIEKEVGVPISMVSVGPNRNQTVDLLQ